MEYELSLIHILRYTEKDDVMLLADFGYKGMNEELTKLRTMTNTIIETQQTVNRYKME